MTDVEVTAEQASVQGEWVRYATKKRTAHFFLDNDADAIDAPALCGAHGGAHGEPPGWEVERIAHRAGAWVFDACRTCIGNLEAELEVGLRRQLRTESRDR